MLYGIFIGDRLETAICETHVVVVGQSHAEHCTCFSGSCSLEWHILNLTCEIYSARVRTSACSINRIHLLECRLGSRSGLVPCTMCYDTTGYPAGLLCFCAVTW